jgi:hypothetical protein
MGLLMDGLLMSSVYEGVLTRLKGF